MILLLEKILNNLIFIKIYNFVRKGTEVCSNINKFLKWKAFPRKTKRHIINLIVDITNILYKNLGFSFIYIIINHRYNIYIYPLIQDKCMRKINYRKLFLLFCSSWKQKQQSKLQWQADILRFFRGDSFQFLNCNSWNDGRS